MYVCMYVLWSDFRSRLYFQSIAVIIRCLPKIAMIENSVNIDSSNGGIIMSRVTLLLANAGYHVTPVRINTHSHGLPQNRYRLYLVCIRRDVMMHPFIIPEDIEPIALGDLLIPRDMDPGHRGMGPNATMATYQISKAVLNLKKAPAEDTIITEHCSDTFQENPIPLNHCPAQTSAKGSGHWLMERGRPLTVEECARSQGYLPGKIIWNELQSQNYFMLGNTMSVSVVQRLLVAALRSIGIHCEDPWNGRAQHNLIADAQNDRISNNKAAAHSEAAQEAYDNPPGPPRCPPNKKRNIKKAIREIKEKLKKHNKSKKRVFDESQVEDMEAQLFELEVCLIHEEDNSGSARTKNADLTKLQSGWAFKSDFNPHVLPAMPKLAIQQVIMPHNPGRDQYEESVGSLSNLHVLPTMPKPDTQQVIMRHNPGQYQCDESVGSLSANSTPRSNDFCENQEDQQF